MEITNLVEWQRVDSRNGLIEPWLTHPFMETIKNWDLSEKVVLELGGGRGTAWWRKNCKWVDTIECNKSWANQIFLDVTLEGLENGRLIDDNIADGTADGIIEYRKLFPTDKQYDIVVVDGIYRVESIEWAIKHFEGIGGIIIIDNLDQDFVFISPKAMELIAPFDGEIFVQPGHVNHEGKPWNTRYVIVPK